MGRLVECLGWVAKTLCHWVINQPVAVDLWLRWMQVGLTTLKGGSTISANAQSLYRVASAKNIRLRSQPSLNRLSYYITYLLALKQN